MFQQSPVQLACYGIRSHGFGTLPVEDMSLQLEIIRRGLWRILDDKTGAMQKAFSIDPSHYQLDEFGEPYEIGILPKKEGRVKEGATLGFFDKAAGRTRDDPRKERFHYMTRLPMFLSQETRLEHDDFLKALRTINLQARRIALEVAREMDRVNRMFPEGHQSIYPRDLFPLVRRSSIITRLVRYHHVKGLASDAQVHRDRALLSVQEFSNVPGLCLFTREGKVQAGNETDPASIIVFTGEKFWAVTRGVFGTGVPHGVYDLRREGEAPVEEERFAVVSFVHIPLIQKDVSWLTSRISELKIDQEKYKTS